MYLCAKGEVADADAVLILSYCGLTYQIYCTLLHQVRHAQRAGAAALACSEGSVEDMLEEFARYRDQVAIFGKAVGIDILSRPHRELAALGEACQVVYKSSGAGGGDLQFEVVAPVTGLAGNLNSVNPVAQRGQGACETGRGAGSGQGLDDVGSVEAGDVVVRW